MLLLDEIRNNISVVLNVDASLLNFQCIAQFGVVSLELLLMCTKRLHILGKLLLVLLRELRCLLELLVLSLVLFQHGQELLLLLNTLLRLLLVLLDLLLDLFSLIGDLLVELLLNAQVLVILRAKLSTHQLHLLCALFL